MRLIRRYPFLSAALVLAPTAALAGYAVGYWVLLS